ncbi:NAD(P)/FAD-dependent oxidoreductase [Filobacillus milosensis]|uniref:NAD(P)/FAD-dependent oxidoreductase n=1 Tax=Filobacillus milosensis TaxID=94137 RepID=A0A4Y8IAX5_9BACI|nr:NAD(P)/FAD-dependent oxidoreductase [Filobacillus milosensis]TFB12990.1 NAD(P)/FAD-dependent oxidoreductase [Filobacillus milosensis]
MTKTYDLIVIGSGAAGSVATTKCNNAGWSVAVIDQNPFGGTCALRGCDPKKVLVGAAELIDWTDRMRVNGVQSNVSINWEELMRFKRTFTDDIPEKKEHALNKQGIDTYHGKASFLSESELNINGEVLKGKHILIASGSMPSHLNIKGEKHLTYSNEFLELNELPKRIIFVGGGYVSFEFAHIAARAGSEVHIIHRGQKPLENFDPNLVDMLLERSKKIGIQVHLEHSVESIEEKQGTYNVVSSNGEKMVTLEADLVVHGAGRVPALDMDLEQGNINRDKDGVKVNEYLQSTSNPNVYAAGDVVSTEGLPLTPVASTESHIVASNVLKGNNKKIDYPEIPSVVFTVPKLASVGMREEEIKESGRNIKVNYKKTTDWFTHKRTNEGIAAYKLLIDEDNDQIVGAHLISDVADELINHFATAIRFKITTKELKKMLFAYPTTASDIVHML